MLINASNMSDLFKTFSTRFNDAQRLRPDASANMVRSSMSSPPS